MVLNFFVFKLNFYNLCVGFLMFKFKSLFLGFRI
jgi:hypothetical protein